MRISLPRHLRHSFKIIATLIPDENDDTHVQGVFSLLYAVLNLDQLGVITDVDLPHSGWQQRRRTNADALSTFGNDSAVGVKAALRCVTAINAHTSLSEKLAAYESSLAAIVKEGTPPNMKPERRKVEIRCVCLSSEHKSSVFNEKPTSEGGWPEYLVCSPLFAS